MKEIVSKAIHRLNIAALKSLFVAKETPGYSKRPDADALFIIAGPCGSGKSTLLRAALDEGLPLYGPDLVECVQSSCGKNAFKNFQEHLLNARRLPYFQARDAMLLGREEVLPSVVLLHIDLYQLLREIDPSYLPRLSKSSGLLREASMGEPAEKKGVAVGTVKRSHESLQISANNDQLLRSYFQDPFFKRFNRIYVNTVLCDYSVNALQLSRREINVGKGPRAASASKRRFKFFRAPEAVSQSIHKEMYASWQRNLSILEPVAAFRTQVDESGDLLLNGSIIAEGWSKRFE